MAAGRTLNRDTHSYGKVAMNTEIIMLMDRSGSMRQMADEVIDGFNSFIEEQRRLFGAAHVTLVQFDNHYEVVYSGCLIEQVLPISPSSYQPRGMTALLDAIGRTIVEQGLRIAAEQWAEAVIVCIITDGRENASQKYTPGAVREMTTHAEEQGWKFVYLGANQDAFSVARSLGLSQAIVENYFGGRGGTLDAYLRASSSVSSIREAMLRANKASTQHEP